MHPSLTPKNNLRLLFIWALACGAIAVFLSRPMLWIFFLTGAALGAVAGYLQLRAMRQSGAQLIAADSAMSVRRALQASSWGKIYLAVFWMGNLAMFVVALVMFRDGAIGGVLAGYASFALLREGVALCGTYELQRLERLTAK